LNQRALLIGGVPMVAWPLTCKGLLGMLLVYVLPQLAASEIGVPLNK